MPQSKLSLRRKTPFTMHRAKPRKMISRSPLNFSVEENARELGPFYQTIDVRIGNQKLILDLVQGGWVPVSSEDSTSASEDLDWDPLDNRVQELEDDNNNLRAKLDILLEILAQVTAEENLKDV